jgi:uncharacterized membrane protein
VAYRPFRYLASSSISRCISGCISGVAGIAFVAVVTLALQACRVQTMNSVNGDATAFGSTVPAGSSPLFAEAHQVFVTNCVSCHAYFAGYAEQDFITNGYVVVGQPLQSMLFQKLSGAVPGGTGDMPQGGQLPASDITTIQNWISGIQATPTPSSSGGPLNAEQRTAAAVAVIQHSCASCHDTTRTATSTAYDGATVPAFAAFTTNSQFAQSGIIIENQPSESWLYQALLTYGSLNLMPEGGPALSSTDAATLNTWITGINNP